MKELNLTRPQAGQSSVMSVDEVSAIVFDFNLAEAHFGRSGSELTIGFGAETRISIADFFSPGAAGSLENIKLANGETVSAKEFLRVLSEDFNIETAADQASADGSGVSDYRDDGGDLLSGVNRLGQGDDLNQWGLDPAGREDITVSVAEADTSYTPYVPPTPPPPEEKPGPEPEPTPDYFVLIGHTGPVEAPPVAEYIAAFSSAGPSGEASSLAGGTRAQVDVSGWDKWISYTQENNWEGEEGPYYEFTSSFGNKVLYNPETGYFGYFPQQAWAINEQLAEAGYYYDFFTYKVLEDGVPTLKFGHVLYVNDNKITNLEEVFNILAESGKLDGMFEEHVGREYSNQLEYLANSLANEEEDYAWLLENVETESWITEEMLQEQLERIEYYKSELQATEAALAAARDKFEAGKQGLLEDLAGALGHPELVEGSDTICQGYENGLEIGAEGQPPIIDREFDKAGFEEFLEQNSQYVTSAGSLANVTVSGTAGADNLDLSYLSLGEGGRVNLGAGDDSILLQSAVGSVVNTGSGDDLLHFVGDGSEYGWTAAVESSEVYLGQGDDQLVVDGNIWNSVIYTDRESADGTEYSGNDKVSLNGQVGGSSIYTGGGDDEVVITGGVSGEAEYGESWDDVTNLNVIDMGAGNDSLTIMGGVSNMDIYMGDGNDHVILDLSNGGVYGSSLDGGSGTDVLTLSSSEYAHNWDYTFGQYGIASDNSFRNFEILHLDLSNGEAEEINLDSLLAQVSGMQQEGRFNSVVITGDEGDTALFSSLRGGEQVSGAPGGLEGRFMHYTAETEGGSMDVYIAIQQQMISNGV